MKQARYLFLLVLLSTISLNTYAACDAQVAISGQVGESNDTIFTCANFPLQFEDQSLLEGLLSVRTWDFGDGSNAVDGLLSSVADYTYTTEGTYTMTLTVSSVLCPTMVVSKTVVVLGQPQYSVSSFNGSCASSCDGKAIISITGVNESHYKVVWNDPDAQNSRSAIDLCPGAYFAVVTDGYGCTDQMSNTVEVNEPSPLVGSLDASSDIDCNGNATGSASVSAAGGTAPYTYDIGQGAQADGNFSGLSANSYTVVVEDANGCQTTVPLVINEPAALSASLDASSDVDCNGYATGSASVSASGGTAPYTYNIGQGAQADGNFSGLAANSYTVVVEDANGCQTSVPVIINEPAVLSTSLDASTDVDCNGNATGSASVSASGGTGPYTYDIGQGAQADGNFAGLSANSYTVVVEDANGCQTTVPVIINEPSALSASLDASTDVDCNGNATGSASVSASGGTAPYTYNIGQGAQADGNFTGLSANSYTVVVEDANGCQTSVPVTINEPAAFAGSFDSSTDADCHGNNTGSVIVSASGGVSPSSFYLDGLVQADGFYTNLFAGSYTVDIEDANDCLVNVPVTVAEPDELVASVASVTDVDCNGNANGEVEILASGGVPAYLFDIGNGQQASGVFAGLVADSYSVVVEDDNGCQTNIPVIVSQPDILAVSFNAGEEMSLCPSNGDTPLEIAISGGTPNYSSDWTSSLDLAVMSETTALFTPTENSVDMEYVVLVSDQNGCEASDTIMIVSTSSSLQGTLTMGGLPCIQCEVFMYEHDAANPGVWVAIDSIETNAAGNYNFGTVNNFQPFVLMGDPNEDFYPMSVETFYPVEYDWNDATVFNMCGNDYVKDIDMIEPMVFNGTNVLSGTVWYDPTGKVETEEDPIPLIDVVVEKTPPGQAQGRISTDEDGRYEFSYVPNSDTAYSLFVNIPGVPVTNTYEILANSGGEVFENLDFCVNNIWTEINTCVVEQSLVTDEPDESFGENFKLYPNPNNGVFAIETGKYADSDSEVRIVDPSGRLVFQKYYPQTPYVINMVNVAEGYYMVQIMNHKDADASPISVIRY